MENDTFKSEKSDEEYQFNEADTSDIYSNTQNMGMAGATTSRPNILEKLKRRNLIVAIVVIVGVIAIYKLLDVLLSKGAFHKTHTVTAPVTQNIPVMTSPKSSEAIPPIATTPSAAINQNQLSVATAGINDRLNNLEQQGTSNQANLTRLTNQVTEMQTNLSALNNRLSDLGNVIQKMANQMEQEQQQQAKAKAAKIAAKQRAKTAPKPIYFVKAIVPGRAWLIAGDNKTITISVGDNLPGYGMVEAIDPNTGTVILSSGAIIGYAPQDS